MKNKTKKMKNKKNEQELTLKHLNLIGYSLEIMQNCSSMYLQILKILKFYLKNQSRCSLILCGLTIKKQLLYGFSFHI